MFHSSDHHLIPFYLDDLDSLRRALTRYRVLLDDNDVMGEYSFKVEFVEASVEPFRRLQVVDAQHNIELLKSSLYLGQEGGPHYYPDHIDDDDESPISEPIFFANALQYPELRSEVVETVLAIVRYARRHNDTNNMWLDDMRVFGAEAIYMLARSDIRYAYLVAQFYIPYWDDEHATAYEGYLCDLLARHGWGEAMIKAFIWCDNPAFRHAVNTWHIDPNNAPPALGDYLFRQPEAYALFVKLLQQRFTQQPVMLATSNDELDKQNPVVDIYLSAFAEWDPYSDTDQTELLQRQVWDSTLEDISYDMQQRIEQQITGPLVCYAESTLANMVRYEAYCERTDNPSSANSLLDEMATLICHLPNGTALWHYIHTGEGFQHLDTLEATSVWPIAQIHASTFYHHMLDECDDDECDHELHSQLLIVLQPALEVWITDNKGKDSSTRLEGRDRFLRLLDIWYRILDQCDLTQRHFLAVATASNLPSIKPGKFYARYTQETPHTDESTLSPRLQKQVSALFSQFDKPSHALYSDSLRTVSLIMSEQRATHDPGNWKPTLACCALAAHLWYQDHFEKRQDAYTERLYHFIDTHFFSAVVKRLIGYGTKALQNHRDRLTQFVHQTDPQIDFDTIVNLLRTHLRTVKGDYQTGENHCISDQQPAFELFESKGSLQNVSLTCAWLANYDNPLQVRARQLLLLLQALAPQRVIAHLAYSHSCSRNRIAFEETLSEHSTFHWLREVGIDKCHLAAFQMSQAQQHNREQYLEWLECFAAVQTEANPHPIWQQQAQLLEHGLPFIAERKRIAFLNDVSALSTQPYQPSHAETDRCLRPFLYNALLLWPQRLATELPANSVLYKDRLGCVPDPLRLPIKAGEGLMTIKGDFPTTVFQHRGDHLALLAAMPGFDLKMYQNYPNNGDAIIVRDNIEVNEIYHAIARIGPREQRTDALLAQLNCYLNGQLDYEAAAAIFSQDVCKDKYGFNFDPLSDYLMPIDQYLFTLPTKCRDRLARLLINHGELGATLIQNQLESAYEHVHLQSGQISFQQWVAQEDFEAPAMEWAIDWMSAIDVDVAKRVIFCLEAEHDATHPELTRLAKRDDFHTISKQLTAEQRKEWVNILGQYGSTSLLTPFLKDTTRRVRNAVERMMNR